MGTLTPLLPLCRRRRRHQQSLYAILKGPDPTPPQTPSPTPKASGTHVHIIHSRNVYSRSIVAPTVASNTTGLWNSKNMNNLACAWHGCVKNDTKEGDDGTA